MRNLSLNQELNPLPLKLRMAFCPSLLTSSYGSDVLTPVCKGFLLQAVQIEIGRAHV